MADLARKTAVSILMNVEKNSAYINIEMNKLRSQDKFSPRDLRFIGELVNGVIKHKLTLDYVISLHSSVKLKKISPFVLAVLRSGVYQLIYMDKIPESAAVNESVKLIKKSSVNRLSGYVNAVLRAVRPEDVENIGEETAEDIEKKYSFPSWIVSSWIQRYGHEFALGMIKSLNEKPGLFVRCNKIRNTTGELMKKFDSEEVVYSPVKIKGFESFDSCFKIERMESLYSMDSFNDGAFYIQDPAAALAAYVTAPLPGETVIDMCCAPGGKSIYMAELMNNEGKIYSCDIYDHKIELIKSNAKKYGAKIIDAQICDATVFKPEFEECADRVLCDVPCSGLGIIRKKPDIKYTHTAGDVKSLSALGLEILCNGARYVKKGGTLVFSTCTVEPEENENVCELFLKNHPEFSPAEFGDGERFVRKTFYPHTDGTDGFFVAKFVKTE